MPPRSLPPWATDPPMNETRHDRQILFPFFSRRDPVSVLFFPPFSVSLLAQKAGSHITQKFLGQVTFLSPRNLQHRVKKLEILGIFQSTFAGKAGLSAK